MTHSRPTRALLACGLAAPLFVAVILVESALRPGYRSVDHFISELSLGRWGWIQVTNFIATGLLLIAFAVGLRSALPTGRGSRSAPILAAACGLALITAGVFSMDPTPSYHPDSSVPDKPTLHGTIHGFMPFTLNLSSPGFDGERVTWFPGSGDDLVIHKMGCPERSVLSCCAI